MKIAMDQHGLAIDLVLIYSSRGYKLGYQEKKPEQEQEGLNNFSGVDRMTLESTITKILLDSIEFKQFWKEKGPFKYALTSREFPPVLLEPEEWIFSNDMGELLKTLMQFKKRKMKVVKSEFNPENKNILRPEMLSPWKINNFPEEWNSTVCDLFVPEGHLTQKVTDTIESATDKIGAGDVETAFLNCLETRIDQLGYQLIKPGGTSKYAAVKPYLSEWEKDEKEAGMI